MTAPNEHSEAWRVAFVSQGNAQLVPFSRPQLKTGQARIRTRFSLVSTGTELAYLTGKHHDVIDGKCSFPMDACGSYSNVGEITEMAPDVEGYRIGDRVFSMAGHASEVVIGHGCLIPLDDRLTDRQAAFCVVGSIALHGVRMASVRTGQTVLVTGQGLIGQLTTQITRLLGADRVEVTDFSQARLDTALGTGATVAHLRDDCPLATSLPRRVDVAIETSGHGSAIVDCLSVVRDGGSVILLGCPHEPVRLDLYADLQKRQLRLIGAYQPRCPLQPTVDYPWSQDMNWRQVLDWISEGTLNVDVLLNDVTAPDQVHGLYKRLIEQDASIAGGIDWRTWSSH